MIEPVSTFRLVERGLDGEPGSTTAVSQSAPTGKAHRPPSLRRLRRALIPYLYLVPGLVVLGVWVYGPLVQVFQLSWYSWNLSPAKPLVPVGAANYVKTLSDDTLGRAALNTIVYIVALLIFTIVVPTAIAILGQRISVRYRTLYQAVIFLPLLVPPVAAAAVWQWLFNPVNGPFTAPLKALGIPMVNLLTSPSLAIFAIIVITGWSLIGFATVLVNAGLADINQDLSHAAAVDGASWWRITRTITVPLLVPTLLLLFLMTILLSGEWSFPIIDVLTAGGPANSTSNMYYLLWQLTFWNFDAGYAAAAGILFFFALLIVTLGLNKLMDRWNFFDN